MSENIRHLKIEDIQEINEVSDDTEEPKRLIEINSPNNRTTHEYYDEDIRALEQRIEKEKIDLVMLRKEGQKKIELLDQIIEFEERELKRLDELEVFMLELHNRRKKLNDTLNSYIIEYMEDRKASDEIYIRQLLEAFKERIAEKLHVKPEHLYSDKLDEFKAICATRYKLSSNEIEEVKEVTQSVNWGSVRSSEIVKIARAVESEELIERRKFLNKVFRAVFRKNARKLFNRFLKEYDV